MTFSARSISTVVIAMSISFSLTSIPLDHKLTVNPITAGLDISERTLTAIEAFNTTTNKIIDTTRQALAQSAGSGTVIGNEIRAATEKAAQEFRTSTTHIIKELQVLPDNFFTKLKTLPLIALGCAGAGYGFWYAKQSIEKLIKAFDDQDTSGKKRALLEALAATTLMVISVITIAKSDSLMNYFIHV